MERFEFVASESTASEIRTLAREYGLSEREVLEQLVTLGLEELDTGRHAPRDERPQDV